MAPSAGGGYGVRNLATRKLGFVVSGQTRCRSDYDTPRKVEDGTELVTNGTQSGSNCGEPVTDGTQFVTGGTQT